MQTTTTPDARRSRRSLVIQIGAIGVALIMVGLLTIQGSQAAFTASTDNGVNNFASGDVVISDDDGGVQVMFDLSDMAPGTTATRCINVTYSGSLTADVTLYGTIAGTGLAPYLDTQIAIGSGAAGGSTFDCTGFSGGTQVFDDTLAVFGATHTDYASGVGGFTGATDTTTRSYQITVTLLDDDNAQAKSATATFVWEAQNT